MIVEALKQLPQRSVFATLGLMKLQGGIPLSAPFGQKKLEISKRFAVLEQIVQDGRIQWIKVGEALCEIRDNKLYKERGYDTFVEYCEIRWGFKKTYAYDLIKGSKAALELPEAEQPKTEWAMRKPLISQRKVSAIADKTAPKPVIKSEVEPMPETKATRPPEEEDLLDEIITRIRRERSNKGFLKALKEWLDESGI